MEDAVRREAGRILGTLHFVGDLQSHPVRIWMGLHADEMFDAEPLDELSVPKAFLMKLCRASLQGYAYAAKPPPCVEAAGPSRVPVLTPPVPWAIGWEYLLGDKCSNACYFCPMRGVQRREIGLRHNACAVC